MTFTKPPKPPEIKEELRESSFTFSRPEKPEGILNFDLGIDESSEFNVPFTNYAVSVDNGVTMQKPELTQEEKDARNTRYLEHFRKNKNTSFDESSLEAAGYDTDSIDSIKKTLQHEAWIPEEGLESDLVTPASPEFHLANKLMMPVMKQFGDLGSYLLRSWETRGIPREMVKAVESGDKEALARFVKEAETIQGLGFGDEMFKGGKVSNNIFEQQKYADSVLKPAVGKLRGAIEKEAPMHPNIADEVKGTVQGMNDGMKIARNKAYDDMYAQSSTNEYDMKPLLADIRKTLTSPEHGIPESALNKVMNIVDYKARTADPVKTKALKSIHSQISKLDEKLRSAPASSKGYLTNQRKSLRAKRDKLKEEVGDTDYIQERAIVNMIKRINANSRGSHFGLSTHDVEVQKGLREAKGMVDDFFKTSVEKHNPEVYELFKTAQNKAREGIKKFGTEQERTPIGRILDGEDSSKVLDSIMNNPYEVKTIASQLEEASPGMGKKLSETWLRKSIGPIRSGKDSIVSGRGVDYSSVNNSLDSLLNNMDAKENIVQMFGQEKYDQLSALKSVIGSLDNMVKSMGYNGPLDEGLRHFISSKGITGMPKKMLEVAFDKTRQLTGQVYDAIPKVAKVGEWIKKIPGAKEYYPDLGKAISGRYDKDTFIMKRLEDYAKSYEGKGKFIEGAEKNLGAWLANLASEEGIVDESDRDLVYKAIGVGLAPSIAAKAIGTGIVVGGYDSITRKISEVDARRTEETESGRTNILDLIKGF